MSEKNWKWLMESLGGGPGNAYVLNREVERRTQQARTQRRRQKSYDRQQDDRIDALEDRAARLESLVVFHALRLVEADTLDDETRAVIFDGIRDTLGEAELTPLDDAPQPPSS